jgi:hypothetical protein
MKMEQGLFTSFFVPETGIIRIIPNATFQMRLYYFQMDTYSWVTIFFNGTSLNRAADFFHKPHIRQQEELTNGCIHLHPLLANERPASSRNPQKQDAPTELDYL